MAGRKKETPPELERTKNKEVRELPDGRVEIIAQTGFKLGGPRDTYSSVEFTHGLRQIVPNDLVVIAEKSAEMDEMIDALNQKRRDSAYRELLVHLNAIAQKTYYEDPK